MTAKDTPRGAASTAEASAEAGTELAARTQAAPHTDHDVGDVADFPDGSHHVVDVAGRQIGIFRIHGRFYGLPNICAHQTGPVCTGRFLTGTLRCREDTGWKPVWVQDGEVIVCPWHGLEYHVPTGQCLAFPEIRLRRYHVAAENGRVLVRLPARKTRSPGESGG